MEESDRFVALLGAGASVEAGLLTSANLTQKIYNDANSNGRSPSYGRLLGYVISKLQTRNAKNGRSPYAPIEVEELFDALSMLNQRDSLLVAEFVERWDSTLDKDLGEFDGNAIQGAFDKLFQANFRSLQRSSSSNFLSSISGFSSDYENLAKALQPKRSMFGSRNRFDDPNRQFLRLLYDNLTINSDKVGYLTDLVSSSQLSLIATLNYDLSIELACKAADVIFDYGLSKWPQQKRVDWAKKDALRYIKLHGSVNWVGDIEEPRVNDETNPNLNANRAMIFGGVDNKLSARGPFLQFLNRFERALLSSDTLLIVGYSFRDDHINAILKRWQLTRKITNLFLVDPFPPRLWEIGFQDGSTKRQSGNREVTYTNNVRIMRAPASAGIRAFLDSSFDRSQSQQEMDAYFSRDAQNTPRQ